MSEPECGRELYIAEVVSLATSMESRAREQRDKLGVVLKSLMGKAPLEVPREEGKREPSSKWDDESMVGVIERKMQETTSILNDISTLLDHF